MGSHSRVSDTELERVFTCTTILRKEDIYGKDDPSDDDITSNSEDSIQPGQEGPREDDDDSDEQLCPDFERPRMRELGVDGDSSSSEDDKNFRLALQREKFWENGAIIKVRFLEGAEFVHELVKKYAKQWEEYANITFDFVDSGESHIRISFQQRGWYSKVGTDAKKVTGSDQATMNLDIDILTPELETGGHILHEFGHALGCIHEHSSPGAGIPWDRDIVYKYYKKRIGWGRNMVDRNVFKEYDEHSTQFTAFDADSIMVYSIPSKLLTDATRAVERKWILSNMDKSFIGEIYEKPNPTLPPNQGLDGPPVNSMLVDHTGGPSSDHQQTIESLSNQIAQLNTGGALAMRNYGIYQRKYGNWVLYADCDQPDEAAGPRKCWIVLDEFIRNEDGQFRWGGGYFFLTSKDIKLFTRDNEPYLSGKLRTRVGSEYRESSIRLTERIVNRNGRMAFVQDARLEEPQVDAIEGPQNTF